MERWTHKDRKGKSSLLFFAGLCMAITIALFSAVAPLGLPYSRATGSAFNPATTSVVLKARSPAEAVAAAIYEPDRPAPVPHSLTQQAWLLPVAMLILTLLTRSVWQGRRHLICNRRRIQPARTQRARAPPAPF